MLRLRVFPVDSLETPINQFTLEFSKKLAESAEGKNIVFSPWGISAVMVYLGSKCPAAARMAQEFILSKVEEIDSGFQTLIAEIIRPGNSYILKTANRIDGEKIYPFHNISTKLWSVNFVEAPDQIRREINSWVESQTEGKISNLLPADSVDSVTRVVLVDTLYCKGTWEHQRLVNTTAKLFRTNKTTSKPMQMMSMKRKFQVFQTEKPQATGLQLYYGSDLSLLILLPDDISGLEKGNTSTFNTYMMEFYDVQPHLPKLKVEDYDLKSTLSDACRQSEADFPGISSEKNPFLSSVFHKSFGEINEQVTEAADGTGSEVGCIRRPSIEFGVDHPFLFFIRHNKTSRILLYERFCAPYTRVSSNKTLLRCEKCTIA
ncbi:LOW QUALITY PROTEIN: serpin B10 [Erethizon dorsatum]